VDATFTLLRRVFIGEMWYEAHRSHAYQILSRRYNNHKKITLSVLTINAIWLFPLAYLASIYEYWAPLYSFIALTPLVLVAHGVKAGMVHD
jgi:Fuc2NAc and GlcNAc transferase